MRTYGDGCGIAHALDVIGERWALLVVRELLLGPKRFTDLRAGLPNASPNVLSQRLRELEQAGVVERRKLPPPAASSVYELTTWGHELKPILLAAGSWALRSPSFDVDAPVGTDSVILGLATFFDPDERSSRPTAGTRDTVAAITRDDVAAFHAREVSPVGATLVLAGDLDDVDAFAAIEAALGGWSAPEGWEAPPEPVAARTAANRDRVVLVDRPGSVQTELIVATPGPDRRVDDGWAPYPVLGFVLGGSPNARVDAVLREEKGYTYGIRSVFRPRRRGGLFLTSGSVRGDVTVESLDILLTILDGARQGFTDVETKQGVDYIAMTAASRYATADAIADEAATLAFEGLTTEFTTATLRDLADVDPERMVDAYGRFADGSWTVIVVGDAAAHADGIRALAHPVAQDVTVVTG